MSDLLNWYSTSYENSQKSDQCLKGCQHGSWDIDLSKGRGVWLKYYILNAECMLRMHNFSSAKLGNE